jgi:hypothetical protein
MLMRTDSFRARSASWTASRAPARSRIGPPRSTDTEAAKFARGGHTRCRARICVVPHGSEVRERRGGGHDTSS